MQFLIIFGPLNRVKMITFSAVQMTLIGLLFLIILICIQWTWNSVFGVVNEALSLEVNQGQIVKGLSTGSESLYETQLLQLRMRLDVLEHKLDRLTLGQERPFKSTYGTLGFHDQGESYGARLDRASGDAIVLDERLMTAQTVHGSSLPAANAMLSAPPLPLPLKVSSDIGYRMDPHTNHIAWHEGVDFQAIHGAPISATGAGVVIRAAWDDEYGYVVDIEHPNLVITRYAHAQQLLVKSGDLVKQSQVIARVGSTGRSTGPHLHYEVLKNRKYLTKG
jgi:murein DD-endopeptidase MepM/ murein hydrolase activator NlpD